MRVHHRPPLNQTLQERLDYYSNPPDCDGHTIWCGPLTARGVPQTSFGRGGKITTAARLAWRAAGKVVNRGERIVHTCDKLLCISIDHLALRLPGGTMPMVAGENNVLAKITCKQDYLAIMADARTPNEIGATYSVTGGYIRLIKLGRTWHVKAYGC